MKMHGLLFIQMVISKKTKKNEKNENEFQILGVGSFFLKLDPPPLQLYI